LSAAAEKRIRAALLEIAEMPVMIAGDEASAAAHRLVGGVERSSADEPAPSAPMKKALPERESIGERSGEARDD